MFSRIGVAIGTLLLFFSWVPSASAQRPTRPTPARARPAPAGSPLSKIPDLRCEIAIADRAEGPVGVIPNGTEVPWEREGGGYILGETYVQGAKPVFWVHAAIHNASEATVDNAVVSMSITNDGVKVPSSPQAQTVSLGPRSGGNSSRRFGPFKIGPLEKRNHEIKATMLADVGNFVSEWDESNNKCDWTVRVKTTLHTEGVAPPGLELLGASLHAFNRLRCEDEPDRCCTTPVPDWLSVRVRNGGDSPSGPFTVKVDILEGCNKGTVIDAASVAPGTEVELKTVLISVPGFQRCVTYPGAQKEIAIALSIPGSAEVAKIKGKVSSCQMKQSGLSGYQQKETVSSWTKYPQY